MKKIFGFTTATLAVFALASCSNDDFFGGAENGFDENAVTLEASVEPLVIGDATRAYVTTDEQYDWAVGDELRVYDNKLQKFDKFLFQIAGSSKAFVLSNTAVSGTVPQYVNPYVDAADETNNAYALFAGSNVVDGDANAISYAGWKQGGTEGTPVALVKIPATLKYKESALSTNSSEPVYKSVVPLWGRVKAPVTDNAKFSTDLNYLTGVIKVTFENANKLAATQKINEVRVRALKKKSDFTSLDPKHQAGILANLKKGVAIESAGALNGTIGNIKVDGADVTTYATKKWSDYFELDNSKPLCGWFDAELTDNGVLVNTTDPVVDQKTVSETRGQLKIDVAGQMVKSTSVLFIPVICGTYDVLVVDYNTAGATTTYTVAGAVKNYEFTKAKVVKTTVSYPNASSIVDGTNTSAISEGIVNAYDGKSAAEVTFNSDADRDLTVMTGADLLNTIYLPQITEKNLKVIIKKQAGTVLQNNLTIADAAGVTSQGTGKVTFVFEGFKDPDNAKKIIINSKANITLAGDFSNELSNKEITLEAGDNCTSLTLGTTGDGAAPFEYGSKPLKVEKGNLTVDNITYTSGTAEPEIEYNNASGTLVVASQVKKVTVTNAASATIKAAAATVEALKNVTINIPHNAEAAKMTVGTLNIHTGVTAIKLDGGIIDNITSQADGDTKVVPADNVTVTSTGLSAIRKYTYATGKIAFTSSFAVPTDGAKTMNFFETLSSDGAANIYTAAQLAAINDNGTEGGQAKNAHVTGFALKTNITALTNWTSPALNKPFDGGKKTITGLTAALFGSLEANVSDLTLANAAITPNAKELGGIGVLANAVASGKTTIVTNVVVSNATLGNIVGIAGSKSANYGLLIGKSEGTTTITDCGVSGTVNGYYNLGGYVGNLAGGVLTISKTEANLAKNMSNVTFNKTFTTSEEEDDNAGKIGNFIGSVSASAKFVIGDATKAKAFSNFFSANHVTAANIANAVKIGTKSYVGMANKEIGLSTASTITFGESNSMLYGKWKNADETPKTYVQGPTAGDNQVVMVNIYE